MIDGLNIVHLCLLRVLHVVPAVVQRRTGRWREKQFAKRNASLGGLLTLVGCLTTNVVKIPDWWELMAHRASHSSPMPSNADSCACLDHSTMLSMIQNAQIDKLCHTYLHRAAFWRLIGNTDLTIFLDKIIGGKKI